MNAQMSVAEEDGCDRGGTVGVSHVYPNRDVLKDCHARGGARAPGAPLVPPPMDVLTTDQQGTEWQSAT